MPPSVKFLTLLVDAQRDLNLSARGIGGEMGRERDRQKGKIRGHCQKGLKCGRGKVGLFPATTSGPCAAALSRGRSAASGVAGAGHAVLGWPRHGRVGGKKSLEVCAAARLALGVFIRAGNEDLTAFTAVQTLIIEK